MVAKLVLTAIQMLRPGKAIAKYFTDSDEARAWLLKTIEQKGMP